MISLLFILISHNFGTISEKYVQSTGVLESVLTRCCFFDRFTTEGHFNQERRNPMKRALLIAAVSAAAIFGSVATAAPLGDVMRARQLAENGLAPGRITQGSQWGVRDPRDGQIEVTYAGHNVRFLYRNNILSGVQVFLPNSNGGSALDIVGSQGMGPDGEIDIIYPTSDVRSGRRASDVNPSLRAASQNAFDEGIRSIVSGGQRVASR
jgi:hypothetical protein